MDEFQLVDLSQFFDSGEFETFTSGDRYYVMFDPITRRIKMPPIINVDLETALEINKEVELRLNYFLENTSSVLPN